MGTSKNVASPDTPPWKPALAVLGRTGVAAPRQLLEIWRSASADRGHRLLDDFATPTLAQACKLASTATNVAGALTEYDHMLGENKARGLGVEVGRRALARAISQKLGSQGFAAELFAEATSYYVSRDLPSFVGSRGRVETMSAAIALKSQIGFATRAVVENYGAPATDTNGWVTYVDRVLRGLQGGRQ
jgi:hypothetical protein